MNKKSMPAAEYNNVATVAATYIEALRTGNIDMLAAIFHTNAVTYGTVDGALVGGGSTNPAADFINANGKSPEIEAHIDVLDLSPTTAAIRIVLEKDAIGSDCNENLLLIKLDTGWKIIAKVFHQFEM